MRLAHATNPGQMCGHTVWHVHSTSPAVLGLSVRSTAMCCRGWHCLSTRCEPPRAQKPPQIDVPGPSTCRLVPSHHIVRDQSHSRSLVPCVRGACTGQVQPVRQEERREAQHTHVGSAMWHYQVDSSTLCMLCQMTVSDVNGSVQISQEIGPRKKRGAQGSCPASTTLCPTLQKHRRWTATTMMRVPDAIQDEPGDPGQR